MKRKFLHIFLLFLFLVLPCLILTGCDAGADEPHDHTVVTWQTVEAPTCAKEGRAVGKCSVCREDMETTLSTLAHTLSGAVVPPTCTEEGYTRYTCECGYVYDSEFVSPLGHMLAETVTDPTCTEGGYTTYTCDCGYTYASDYVSPLGHTLTETVILPTCTEGGYTHFVCTVCGYEHDGNPTQPLSHRNTVSVVYYPTFERDGFTRHTCSDCGQSYDDTVVRYADIVTGAYTDNTEILMQGIDVSKWNHEYGVSLEDIKPLDWEALKAAGVDFVILKAGSTNGIDPSFEMNYRDAKAAGLQVGAYFYAYSDTVEETLADADMLLSWLAGKQFELPIYFDLEEISLMELGGEALTEICKAFIGRVQEAGYYGALYTNTEWMYNLLDTEWIMENLDVWYARYTTPLPEGQEGFSLADEGFEWKDGTAYKPGETDKRYGIWQYTDSGVIEGFRYKFDFSYAFKDYAPIMAQWGLNGFAANATEAEIL